MRFEFLPAFKGDSFLIHAGTEDEPALILVDGGPGGTYEDHLRPRLMELREERGLGDGEPLVIDLVIVSHVDDDHIAGIVEMLGEMRHRKMAGDPPLFKILGLWHNSFDEIIDNDEVAAEAAQFGAASFGASMQELDEDDAVELDEEDMHDSCLILQSVAQGHELRSLATSMELQIPLNDGKGGLIRTSVGEVTTHEIGGVKLTVIGPRTAELAALQETHDDWLEEQARKGKPVTSTSMLQSLSDDSVANLSSIVLLAERDGRSALLTGDARSDFVIKGLEEIGLVAAGGELRVDLLKMPHHGSDRNVDEDFLRRVTAPKYLFTGNGEHGNPERATFEMLAAARPGAPMEFYLTYTMAEIDPERRKVQDKERNKELKKEAAGKLKPGKTVRDPWSDEQHSVAKLVKNFPAHIKVEEPDGPFVVL